MPAASFIQSVQAIDLSSLDLAVPVGAFDQANHQPVAAAPRQIDDEIIHSRAALLVRLDDEAVPAQQRRLEAKSFEQVERALQPLRLFSINVQADVTLAQRSAPSSLRAQSPPSRTR